MYSDLMLPCPALQLTELEGDMALARSHLEEVHGGGRLTTQSQLDSAQVELREANAKAEEARQLHEQVSHRCWLTQDTSTMSVELCFEECICKEQQHDERKLSSSLE